MPCAGLIRQRPLARRPRLGKTPKFALPPPRTVKAEGKMKKVEQNTRQVRKGAKFSAMSDEMIDIGLKLKEPFTAAELAAAAKVPQKDCSNCIVRWKLKGWLTKVARGSYKRTKDFGDGIVVARSGESLLANINKEIDSTKPENIYE